MTRRHLLAVGAFFAIATVNVARAQDAGGATAFIQSFGSRLVSIVNGDEPLAQKQQEIRPLIDGAVDVNAVAQFCLGHAATTATPQQKREFVQLFHGVLVNNITAKVGQFKGVSFRMTNSVVRDGAVSVGTVVTRPNEAPANVQWVVSSATGSPKIIDVIAEGTSLRLTQRSDYASFLSRNNENVDALLAAMRRQAAG